MQIQHINFFTTYKCNSRCINCLIWKNPGENKPRNPLGRDRLKQLFTDPVFTNCPNIGLAGGEPTISPFFWELLEILPSDKFITITTNALNTKKLIQFLSQYKDKEQILIQVSLDGIGEVNDNIRGVAGAFEKSILLLGQLQKLKIKSLVSFTINKLNYHQLFECYELANTFDAQFSARMAHIGGAYENKGHSSISELNTNETASLETLIDKMILKEIKKPNPVIERLIFFNNIIPYAKGNKIVIDCHALTSGLVVDLYGDVFPTCPNLMTPVGNVTQRGLTDILNSKRAKALNRLITTKKCVGCWNDCQMITNISRDGAFKKKEQEKLVLKYFESIQPPEIIDVYSHEFELAVKGLYPSELDKKEGCCWTKQTFYICLPKGFCSIKLHAMLPRGESKVEPGKMEVTIDDRLITDIFLVDATWQEYQISLNTPVEQLKVLKCKLNRYYCPFEENGSQDNRRLGLAVNQITYN